MTIKQIQLLLTYLGYDVGSIDGVNGEKTRGAVESFQKDFGELDVDGVPGKKTQDALRDAVYHGMPVNDETTGSSTDEENFWDGIKYFTKNEFACKCPRCGGFPVEPNKELVKLADSVRQHFGKPMIISSGIRCTEHNREVGGVYNSRHLSGKAVDFSVRGLTADQILSYVKSIPGVRYSYPIDGSYVHMDVN